MAFMTDIARTRTIGSNANIQPESETQPSAFYGGRIITRHYDSLNRPTGFDLGTSGDPDEDHAVAYGYDTAGRLASVQDPNRTWTYAFVPNSGNLVSNVTSGTNVVTYTYESGRNAITSVENMAGATTVSHYTYTNNALGQRTGRTQGGTAFSGTATESFGYNAKGEVISSTHSLDSARNTAFDYDGIGNRNEATFGGVTTAYTANVLNQYSEIDPGTPATPTYDDDGNMLNDGSGKNLVWDGENRLIEVRDASNALVATYIYDGQSRRVKKVTTSAAPQGAGDEVYLYDGWNRIATYSVQSSSFILQTSHTWGRDLSGTLGGAGGVGGLLGVEEHIGIHTGSYAFHFDANGNVSDVLSASGGIAAHYEYDAFGNAIVTTGSYVSANTWQFSNKAVDAETGFLYYGYRYYNPLLGRWVSRDPIEESGGTGLYTFCGNSSTINIDAEGLSLSHYNGGYSFNYFSGPKIGPLGRRHSGETDPGWEFTVKILEGGQSFFSVENSGRMYPVVYVDPTLPLNEFRSTVAHEKVHIEINAKWWNKFVDEANSFENKYYCKKECAQILARYLERGLYVAYLSEAYLENARFDRVSYGGGEYGSAFQLSGKKARQIMEAEMEKFMEECAYLRIYPL